VSGLPVVVIPVFNAPSQLGRCLAAVRKTVDTATDVVVIDDASTDPAVAELLESRCAGWTVMHQPENRGFVATANRGMQEVGRRDVILLNSDTIPAGDWLQRISRCAGTDSRIASITPFTNNGEIASLPLFCKASPVPEDPEAWARACRQAADPSYPEIPTAVGFCMYMRRACIDAIGAFDEAAFGRGYGEENDWCMRAVADGYRHVLCDDAFVAHEGNASFGPLGLGPGEAAMRKLLERHPDYLDVVTDFIRRDPLAAIRARILERLPH
jgi:GT2 family glycosyltransferase